MAMADGEEGRVESGRQERAAGLEAWKRRLFYFYIFRKYFLQKYIFNITIYSFVPLPPPAGR